MGEWREKKKKKIIIDLSKQISKSNKLLNNYTQETQENKTQEN